MPTAQSQSVLPALPSIRGLVLGANTKGVAIDSTTVRQWLRLSAEKFKAQKVDLYLPNATVDAVDPLLEEAKLLGLRLSLRTTDATSPDVLPTLAEASLLDVALQAGDLQPEALRPWFQHAAKAALPLRLLIDAVDIPNALDSDLVDLLGGATSVRIALQDEVTPKSNRKPVPEDTIDHTVALATALQTRGTEIHVLDIPFCQLPEALWPAVANTPQRLASHPHYRQSALEFAQKVKNLSPGRIHQAVETTLGKGVSFHNRIDDAVLPWILEHPWYFFWVWFLHKLTRRLPLRRPKPVALPENLTELEAALAVYREKQQESLGPVCAGCRLHPICDHHTETFKQAFPGRMVEAQPGEPCHDPRAFLDQSAMHCDAVDATRLRRWEDKETLAEEARHRLATEAPTREIPAESYDIQDHKTHHMPASVRWFSFSTAELQSTVLARLSPPFTLSVTVGGGIAERMGFALGRHTRLMCPMTAYTHKLTLHVDADGHYVLLRDGETVEPLAFADGDQVPERIGSIAEPRIALANIDGQIVTQTVLLWEGDEDDRNTKAPQHSVVIVCTQYARRLQAALMALANADASLEVLVGYVPGIDATDDVLDSLAATYPDLRVVRMPFAPQHARAKGFIINECLEMARGAWITLLDADIMLPPDYFTRLEAQPEEATFVAPDGRHMLSPETTAEILLGLKQPWKDYDDLLASPGEYRRHESDGVPPGFCQSVRRKVFDDVRYQELDHFEGSDWWFSAQVIEKFGKETRLAELRVLHLDHGGSQWYGTEKQF